MQKKPSSPEVVSPAKAKLTKPAHTPKPPKTKLTKHDVGYVIFLLAWTAISLILSQFIVAYPMSWLLGSNATTPFWTLIYYILNYSVAFLLIFVAPKFLLRLYQRHQKLQAQKRLAELEQSISPTAAGLGLNNWPTFTDLGLAPIAYIIYTIVGSVLIKLVSLIPWFDADQPQNVGFGYFITTSDRVFALIAIVFIAPIAEEIIMRGWLYGKLRQKLGIIASMLSLSVLFAVLHGQLNVAITTFCLSLALCGLREITGSLWSSILLHILSNGIAFYALYVAV